jgi:hypothetical protein
MLYEQTKKKEVDAIIWTGQNVKEIKEFLPSGMYRFDQDHITQLLSLVIIDNESRMYYTPKWGDYIVHTLDDNKYKAISKNVFESEYTEYSIIHPNKEIENNKWDPYVNVQFVIATPSTSTSGKPGYKVKDSNGFIKFYLEEEFKKSFKPLKDFMSNDIELKVEESTNG